jgi:N-acetylmuramic acid 6-phosphate etherase
MHSQLGIGDPNELMRRVYVPGMAPAEIAALAPLVLSAASTGDEVAQALIRQGAGELTAAMLIVAERLGMAHGDCELVLVGGLFKAGDALMSALRELLASALPKCVLVSAEAPPAHGACLLAKQLLAPPATGFGLLKVG